MALVYLEESLDLAKSGRNKRRMAVAMANLGNVELQTGEYDAAQRRYRDAHAVYKEIGDLSGIANALMDSASVSLEQGDYHEALVQSEHSRFIYRDLSDPLGEAYALTTSARAQLRSLSSGSTDSNFGRVYESLKECVSLMGDVQDRTLAVDILELFAQAYAGEGRSRDALDLIATTTAERNKTSSRPSTAEKIRLDELLASLRSRLGDAEADQVWAAGSLKSIEDAVAAV